MACEKDDITSSGKSAVNKRLFYVIFACLLLFTFAIVTSYYGIRLVGHLHEAHVELQRKIDRLEIENKEAVNVLVRTVASVNNITGALELFFAAKHNKENTMKHLREENGFRKRRRRRNEGSTVTENADKEDNLRRTIHGFRREMFSLNDRYV